LHPSGPAVGAQPSSYAVSIGSLPGV